MTWAVDPQLFQWLLSSSCPMVGDLGIPGLRLQLAFPFGDAVCTATVATRRRGPRPRRLSPRSGQWQLGQVRNDGHPLGSPSGEWITTREARQGG